MHVLDQGDVPHWIDVGNGQWYPASLNTHCPHCSARVTLTLEDRQIDPVRNTIVGSGACPNCRQKSHVWAVEPRTKDKERGAKLLLIYPSPSSRQPAAGHECLPDRVRRAYLDTLDTFNLGLLSPSATSCRRTLEGMMYALIGNTSHAPLMNQLRELGQRQDLGAPIVKVADAVRKTGNLGAHFDLGVDPDPETVGAMLDLMDFLIECFYKIPLDTEALTNRLANIRVHPQTGPESTPTE